MEFFENLDKKKVEVPFFIGELTTLVFGATEIVSFCRFVFEGAMCPL